MTDHGKENSSAACTPPRLLDLARQAIRRRPYSYRTEEKDVSTTMIYTHMLNNGGRGVKSPLDRAEQGAAEYRAA